MFILSVFNTPVSMKRNPLSSAPTNYYPQLVELGKPRNMEFLVIGLLHSGSIAQPVGRKTCDVKFNSNSWESRLVLQWWLVYENNHAHHFILFSVQAIYVSYPFNIMLNLYVLTSEFILWCSQKNINSDLNISCAYLIGCPSTPVFSNPSIQSSNPE